MQLAIGRECGSCSACCTIAAVASTELTKPPNSACPHCEGAGGCRIYASRPIACQESYCGWRIYPELGADWRPDISGVLILTEPDAPRAPGGRPGLKFVLLRDDAVIAPSLVGYITALVSRDVPVSIAVLGPTGHWPVKAFVNRTVREALRTFDSKRVEHALLTVVRSLRDGTFEKAAQFTN